MAEADHLQLEIPKVSNQTPGSEADVASNFNISDIYSGFATGSASSPDLSTVYPAYAAAAASRSNAFPGRDPEDARSQIDLAYEIQRLEIDPNLHPNLYRAAQACISNTHTSRVTFSSPEPPKEDLKNETSTPTFTRVVIEPDPMRFKKQGLDVLLKDFSDAESELKTLLKKPNDELLKDWDKVSFVRKTLEDIYRQMVDKNIEFVRMKKVDSRIWSVGYYPSISALRKLLSKSNELQQHVVKGYLSFLLDEGILFFKEVLKKLDDTCGLVFPPEVEENFWYKKKIKKEKSLELNLKYNYLISIGDLHRYGGTNKKAQEYYEKARQLHPDNGRAYSLMMFVAFNRDDTISEVYYLMRAMTSAVSVDGARAQLEAIFDTAYKKHEADAASYWWARGKMLAVNSEKRTDIWIHPLVKKAGWEPQFFNAPQSKDEHIGALTAEEIYAKFTVSYLWAIGRFYTIINYDEIHAAAEEALVYFQGYLKKSKNIPFVRMVQLYAINAFILKSFDWKLDDYQGKPRDARYEVLLVLLRLMEAFFLEMMVIAGDEVLFLCGTLDWDSRKMQSCSAFVMLCTKWLRTHNKILWRQRYRPSFCIGRIENTVQENLEDMENDVWIAFAELCDCLSSIFAFHKDFLFPSVVDRVDWEHPRVIKLPEYTLLYGFEGMLDVEDDYFHREKFLATEEKSMIRAQNFVRLRCILDFGKFELVKARRITTTTHDDGSMFFSNRRKYREYKYAEVKCGLDKKHYNYWIPRWARPTAPAVKLAPISYGDQETNLTDNCSARVILKTKKPKPVQDKTQPRVAPDMPVWKIFSDLKQNKMKIEVVICPKNIIIDTNTFINDLPSVKLMMPLFADPLMVPLSVILELKGLSKGGFTNKDKKMYTDENSPGAKEKLASNKVIADHCIKALKLIEENLGKKFIIISCYGRNMEEVSSVYDKLQDDYYDKTVNNDARILAAGAYLEADNKKLREMDLPYRIYRETMIVTDDRMMKVFASDLDLPYCTAERIVYWAYHCLEALKSGEIYKRPEMKNSKRSRKLK